MQLYYPHLCHANELDEHDQTPCFVEGVRKVSSMSTKMMLLGNEKQVGEPASAREGHARLGLRVLEPEARARPGANSPARTVRVQTSTVSAVGGWTLAGGRRRRGLPPTAWSWSCPVAGLLVSF